MALFSWRPMGYALGCLGLWFGLVLLNVRPATYILEKIIGG